MTLEERRIIWNKRKEERRKAKLRKLYTKGVLVLSLIACVNIVFLVFFKPAQAKEEKAYYKYYTSYEVQPGDTLNSIADQFMEWYSSKRDYIDELKQTNCIHNQDKIRAGQIIHVPYLSTEIK